MSKTLRLIFPEWQGGMNPHYAQGSEILSKIVPQGKDCKVVEVPVSKDYHKKLSKSLEVAWGDDILEQQQAAYKILEQEQPDKILTLGGDCSVSQAPFDYLHGKYPNKTGILWIDAHPDISKPQNCPNEHAMVLGNLFGEGAEKISQVVKHKFKPSQVLYVGVIKDELLDYEVEYNKHYQIQILTPNEVVKDSNSVVEWLKKNNIENLIVHFDMDVLTSEDFRSLLYNEPHIPPVEYATGKLTLAQVVRIIFDASKIAKLVGLTIAEYMPWDIINIRREFSKLEIFND